MGVIATNIIENDFIKNNSSLYDLSVLIGTDRFSYAILGNSNELLVLKSYAIDSGGQINANFQEKIQDIFIEDETLTLPYKNIFVGLHNNINTIIPNHLFDENELVTYLKGQTENLADKAILKNTLNDINANNVFAYHNEIYLLVKGYFPNAKFIHGSTALITGAIQNFAKENQHTILVNVQSSIVHILLLEGKDLIFSNGYTFHSSKDFTYYVMLVYDQFKLSPENVSLLLSGQITKESEIFNGLSRYIKDIQFSSSPSNISFGKNFDNQPAYYFFDLFSLSQCG